MKHFGLASSLLVLLASAAVVVAQEHKPAAPQKEHEWLRQLVGEWEGDWGQAKSSTRMLGEIWMVSDVKASFGDTSMSAMMTLGYDPQKKKYVGTWIDSLTAYLWKYEGTLDASGKALALDAEGPNPAAGGKMTKMRDTIEIKSKDHFVLIASMLGDDGKWQTFMTINYRRKK
jgi:hypothetical protein